MALKIYSFGSGSKGNCTLITDGKTKLLLDAGLNINVIVKKLNLLGLTPMDLDGLLITHEHDDHVKSVEMLSPFLPVYSHPDTLEQVVTRHPIPLKNLMETEEKEFSIGTLDIIPFRVSHDAAHPYGFLIKDWETKFAYLTDTGYVSKGMMSIIRGSDIVMLESNHDKELLLRGKYPEYLKRRILSDRGHLSNAKSALTSLDLIESGARKIVLSHISEQNNLPELAYWTTKNFLRNKGVKETDASVIITSQHDTVVVE